MSGENVDIAQRLFPGTMDVVALLNDPEAIEAVEALVHPDFETVFEDRTIPLGGFGVLGESGRLNIRGLEGLVTAWRDWLGAWETWVATRTKLIDVDDERVLVLMNVQARSRTHQVEMSIDSANLLTLRGGKLARLQLFLNQTDALEAAGLSE